MEIIKCSDFINEGRVNKKEVTDALIDLFKSKRNVEMDLLPNERGLYSLAGMKKSLSGRFDSDHVDNALHDLLNDKKSGIKSKGVNISIWNSAKMSPTGGKSVPYWYMGLTDAQATKLKNEYESEEEKKNKKAVVKNIERKGGSVAKSTDKKGADRKPGAPRKKAVKKAAKK